MEGLEIKTPDWDSRYRDAVGGLFGEAPCPWLRMLAERPGFTPRSALLPADGDGRNGAWLAARGVAVTAIDVSAEATRQARLRDAALGVEVERITADLARWRPQRGRRWEACAIFYLQGPETLRLDVLSMAALALTPGGWLALEGFAATPRGAPTRATCGPDDPDKLYALGPTRAALERAGLEIVEALTGEALLDEGPRHRGAARILRLLARAPQAA